MFDLDNCLGDFVEAFRNTGLSLGIIPKKEYPEVYDMFDMYSSEEKKAIWKKVRQTDNFWKRERCMLNDSDRKAIAAAKSKGHKIIIVTDRSDTGCTDAYSQTEQWLAENNIPFDELYVSGDKGAVCKMKSINYAVDDYPKNIKDILGVGIVACTMAMPYNKEFTDAPRVDSIAQFLFFIGAI